MIDRLNDAERADWLISRSKNDKESGAQNYLEKCGYLLYEISKLKAEFNENYETAARIKWRLWYEGNLIKRVLKKFKLKEIYRSKKGKEYYKKYLWKNPKIKPEILKDMPKDVIVAYIAKVGCTDLKNAEIYRYVIKRIQGENHD